MKSGQLASSGSIFSPEFNYGLFNIRIIIFVLKPSQALKHCTRMLIDLLTYIYSKFVSRKICLHKQVSELLVINILDK